MAEERDRGTDERDRLADERDRLADARDEQADARDDSVREFVDAALQRDAEAERRDRDADDRDDEAAAAEDDGRGLAAVDRVHAGRDRDWAAHDREQLSRAQREDALAREEAAEARDELATERHAAAAERADEPGDERRPAPRTILDGLGFAEGPRWRDGRLWFSDMGTGWVSTVDLDGRVEQVVEVPGRPSGLGWLPDGDLLVVSMGQRQVLRWDGASLHQHADLSALASHECNDMVVDGQGRAYVGNAGFDLREQPLQVRPAEIVLVLPDGTARVVDDEVVFPNGSVVTPDGSTLIVGETFGRRLTAFTVAPDGSLTDRRTMAELPDAAPDGICLDAEGAVWVADATGTSCLRVSASGQVVETVETGRPCFACMLGGPDRRTLFLLTAEGFGGRAMARRTARIEAVEVAVPGAGWP